MDTYTVSFCGHRQIENTIQVESLLENLVASLLRKNNYVVFLVGRDGDFDLLVASVIRRCKKMVRSDNSSLVWVLPYPKSELLENEEDYRNYYDEIEVCLKSQECHYKGAYRIRNRDMVDRSDLVVCCVQHKYGGAWETMKYAQRQRKCIVCLNKSTEVMLCERE